MWGHGLSFDCFRAIRSLHSDSRVSRDEFSIKTLRILHPKCFDKCIVSMTDGKVSR